MSKLVTSDNLKAYHSELAEHLQLLERDKAYSVGDTVKYDGLTLKCTIAGNTDVNKVDYSSIDVGDTIVDGTVTFTVIDPNSMWYEEDKFYMVDDIVVYNDKFYKCITAHTATATFDTTKWSEISAGGGGSSGGGISIWQANTAYNVNDVVIDSNLIWQCAIAHTSASTFDESKWICISGGEISNGMEIIPLWEGEFSFDNSTQGSWPTSSTTMIELSESIDNFEHIYVTTCTDSRNNHVSTIVPVSSFNNDKSMRVCMYETTSGSYNIEIVKYDSLHLAIIYKAMAGWSSGYVKSVRGIRKAPTIVSSGMKYETLWEGEAGNYSGESTITINLSEPINKYKKIGFCCIAKNPANNSKKYYYREITVSEFLTFLTNAESNDSFVFCWGYGSKGDAIEIKGSSSNSQLVIQFDTAKITKVIGISEGVQIPTGVQAARVTLFEGRSANTVTLLDDYTNYDELEFVIAYTVGYDSIKQYTVATDILKSTANTSNVIIFPWGYSDSDRYLELQPISSNTQFNFAGSQAYLTKITGIKYIQPDSYSTEEKLIGTWIDGKHLYRKVFTPAGSGTSLIFESGLTGTNYNIQRIYGYVLDAASNILPVPFNDGTTRFTVYISYSTGTVHIETNQTNYTVKSVIVEYTKN